METLHELFIHELTDMLSAERQLVEALEEQERSASNDQLKKAFAAHRVQTEKQIERLQTCFTELGEEVEETECKGIAGLIEEYKSFKEEEDPSEEILDCFSVGAAIKVESYEINAYESLIDMAESMGHDKVAKLLNQSLKEEESTREKLEALGKKLEPADLGMEEGEAGGETKARSSRSPGSSRPKKSGKKVA